jgi:hypothetical protein
MLAVQISKATPPDNVDYLKTLIGAADEGATPVAIGTNGQLLPRAFVPGGGGVGSSVAFEKGDLTVVVGLTKEDSNEKVEAAARAVEAKLS